MPNQELWAKSDSATRFTVKRDELRVEMERVYDASPERVFNAFIDSDLVSKWWGPRGTTTIIDKNEVRPGGAWRFVVRSQSGKEEAFNGKYVEIKPHASITHTFNYEPIGPGHELKETATFQPVENGKTKVTTTSFYDRIEELDGMVGSGMEKGAVETFERLAELLEATK